MTRFVVIGDAEEAERWGFGSLYTEGDVRRNPDEPVMVLLEGSTAMHIGVRHNPNHQVITSLIEGGGDPSIEDNWGKTPWDYATEREYLKDTEGFWRLNDARWH